MKSGSWFCFFDKGFCQKSKTGGTLCIKEENISCEANEFGVAWCKVGGVWEDLAGKKTQWNSSSDEPSFRRRHGLCIASNKFGSKFTNYAYMCRAARHFGKL